MSSGPGAPPLTPICHLCGKSFGTASLPLHLPKCAEKYVLEQSRLPALMRQSPPEMPLSLPLSVKNKAEMQEYNDQAFEIFAHAALNRCTGCGRSFNVDALVRHLDSCNGTKKVSMSVSHRPVGSLNAASTSTSTSASRSDGSSASTGGGGGGRSPVSGGPVLLTCHYCCRGFGVHSLGRHLYICKDKHEKRICAIPMQLKPKVPRVDVVLQQLDPELCASLEETDGARIETVFSEQLSRAQLEAYTDLARQTYEQVTRVACPHCKRRFEMETCVAHVATCSKNTSRMDAYEEEREMRRAKAKGPITVLCPSCGKMYGRSSIPIHWKNGCEEVWRKRHPGKEPPSPDTFQLFGDEDDIAAIHAAASPISGDSLRSSGECGSRSAEAGRAPTPPENDFLVPCQWCGRTFARDRIEVHHRLCTQEKPAKRASSFQPKASPATASSPAPPSESGSAHSISESQNMNASSVAGESMKKAAAKESRSPRKIPAAASPKPKMQDLSEIDDLPCLPRSDQSPVRDVESLKFYDYASHRSSLNSSRTPESACHECNFPFPTAFAKFCSECGAKRNASN
eukprot:ANDGO_04595.mRNA.1 hypothetical protein (macronuclear)